MIKYRSDNGIIGKCIEVNNWENKGVKFKLLYVDETDPWTKTQQKQFKSVKYPLVMVYFRNYLKECTFFQ